MEGAESSFSPAAAFFFMALPLTVPLVILLIAGAGMAATRLAGASGPRLQGLGTIFAYVSTRWHRWLSVAVVMIFALIGAYDFTESMALSAGAALIVFWVAINSDEADGLIDLVVRGALRLLRIARAVPLGIERARALKAQQARVQSLAGNLGPSPVTILERAKNWLAFIGGITGWLFKHWVPVSLILVAVFLWWMMRGFSLPFGVGQSKEELRAELKEAKRENGGLMIENQIARAAIPAAEETFRVRVHVVETLKSAEDSIDHAVSQDDFDLLHRVYVDAYERVWNDLPSPNLDDPPPGRVRGLHETGASGAVAISSDSDGGSGAGIFAPA